MARPAASRVVPLLVLALMAALPLLLGGRQFSARADFAFCNQQEVASLDPHVISGAPEGRIVRALFEGLTRADPKTLEALPGAATHWQVSDDGLEWRFFLREDAAWSDGSPLTAHDFDWSFRRLLHPRTAAPYANLLWMVRGAEAYSLSEEPDDGTLGIEAAGDHELVLHLVRPCTYLPSLLSYYPLMPVPGAAIEEHGGDWIKPHNIVTNGAFRLVERRVRDRIRLERNPHYWDVESVALETIDAFAADGTTTQLNMYLTGMVDWMVKPPTSLYEVLLPREDAVVGLQIGMTFYRFNTTEPPFDDVRVRTALLLALDRRVLAHEVMRGGEQPATSYVPPGLAGYEPVALAPQDPARARALLAEAGYPGGEGFPEFELLLSNNEVTRDFCEATAAMWRRELGIHCRLARQPFRVFLDSMRQGKYDVAWSAWIGDYLDPSTFLDIFHSESGNNRTGWSNPDYDRLLGQAAAEPDPARRNALFAQAETLLLTELPIAPVYQRMNFNMVSPRVEGFHDNLLDVHPLRDISIRSGNGGR